MLLAAIQTGGYIGIGVGAFVALCLVILIIRAAVRPQKQESVESEDYPDLDKQAIATHLQEALRFETISMVDDYAGRDEPFLQMRQWILKTYPNVAEKATLTIIGGYSLG